MLLLTGEYELALDSKNRLAVPSKVREQIPDDLLGSGFYLVPGANRILSLYPEKYYQRIALVVAPGTAAPDELIAYERVNFALAGKVELDRQGRVLLPEKALNRAGLLKAKAQTESERVTLIGARDHLEIWNPERWERFVEQSMASHEKMLMNARVELLRQEQSQHNPGY